ncbi:unnamed protein product [Lactuca virosa]|uniref:Uncharacterized protein n=1 Tax=Lactuca virosa TaxID=75947 RepID=A0AAU9MXT4_9ASTR|nr:unnamed protein product [Lactuca virosa]
MEPIYVYILRFRLRYTVFPVIYPHTQDDCWKFRFLVILCYNRSVNKGLGKERVKVNHNDFKLAFTTVYDTRRAPSASIGNTINDTLGTTDERWVRVGNCCLKQQQNCVAPCPDILNFGIFTFIIEMIVKKGDNDLPGLTDVEKLVTK